MLANRPRNVITVCWGVTYKPEMADLREKYELEAVAALAQTYGLLDLVYDLLLSELPASLKGPANVHLVYGEGVQLESDASVYLVGYRKFKRQNSNKLLSKIVETTGLILRPTTQ